MAWPTSTDYNEAIQNPQVCFADADLRAGQADGLMGLPTPFSGNFADVYKLMCLEGKNWAIKCFTREVQGLQGRYQAVSEHLREQSRPFMVEFQYQEQGIKVKGAWYPIVRMSWGEGFALNQFVADHAGEAPLLERLAEMWSKLAVQLREARMAHGDLQHGNVLLVPGSKANALALKLIDYDGMFVPALADTPSGELGHRNYQHPRRQDGDAYHPEMDRFANLAIYTALRCVGVGGELWSKYGDPENLLFRHQDFVEPGGSAVLRELWQLPNRDARTLAGHLVLASAGRLADVPLLSELLGGGTVRPLAKGEEARVEGLLGARPAAVRKTRFDPRALQKAAKNEVVPPLPSPLQPSDVGRKTVQIPPVPATIVELREEPPPLPIAPLPPPLPMSVVLSVPPPLPEASAPPPLPALSPRLPELLPLPLPAARRPAAKRGRRKRRTDDDKMEFGYWRDSARKVWRIVGIITVILLAILTWRLWPKLKANLASTHSTVVLPQIHSLTPEKFDLIVGGDVAPLNVLIDGRSFTGPMHLEIDGLPAEVLGPRKVTLRAKQDTLVLWYRAEQTTKECEQPITVSLWANKELAGRSSTLLTVHK